MHLDATTLGELAAGTLAEPALSAAKRHLEQCESCSGRTPAERTQPARPAQEPPEVATLARGTPPAAIERIPKDDPPGLPEILPERIGPYVPLERLGEGGMGTVYSAYHRELDRKVALKLIRADSEDEEARVRLLREAQAMARLDHPNVVAVHDFGQYQGQVYLAMDRVDGKTLKAWLAEKPRAWREIVVVFLQAGRGLAAAHAAGMMHRDFKPANVLVGNDGRVRVSDFGLARAVGPRFEPEGDGESTSREPPPKVESSDILSSPLTLTGSIVGTPRYMSPEQFDGKPGDPRTDQFSFCVALFEALYREKPFEGRPGTFRLKELPKDRPVPRFLRKVVLRGLSLKPEQRFASMEALLEALAKDPARQALRLAAICAVILLAAVAVFSTRAALRPAPVVGCEDPGAEWKGIWDLPARAELLGAFNRARVASTDAAREVASLDAYAREWSQGHAEACRLASTAHHDENALLRLTCLERQRTEAGALIEVLRQGDPDSLKNAHQSLGILMPPSRCADPRILAALPRPPSDPKARLEVQQLRVKLATARAQGELKPQDALPKLVALKNRATELGYRPLEAEAFSELGRVEDTVGDARAAEKDYLDAENAAEAGGADLFAAEVASNLAFEFGARGDQDLARASEWLARGKARLERVGGDAFVEALLEDSAAAISDSQGRPEETLQHERRALALAHRALGPTNPRTLQYEVSAALRTTGVLSPEETRAEVDQTLKDLDAAGAPIRLRWSLYQALVVISTFEGKFEDAEKWLRSMDGVNAEGGFGGIRKAATLEKWAQLRLWQRRYEEGLKFIVQAEQVGQDPSDPDLMSVEGELLEALGQHQRAEKALRKSLAIFRKSNVQAQLSVADPTRTLGQAEVQLGRSREAVEVLEPLIARLNTHQNYRGELALAQLVLAEALASNAKERAGAAQLASRAIAELNGYPWLQADAKSGRDWFRAHRFALP